MGVRARARAVSVPLESETRSRFLHLSHFLLRTAAHFAGKCSTLITVTLLGLAVQPAQSQDYPNRAVTIVAPSAPGGLYSLFARLIGSKLEQRFGNPFIVENT